MKTVIYTLDDPRTGEVRYVGKTHEVLNDRLKRHLRSACNRANYKDNWINSLLAQSVVPRIDSLEEVDSSDEGAWQEAEKFWISTLRFLGCKLTNLAVGGEGGLWSPESRRKLGNALRGKKKSPEHCEKIRLAKFGVKRPSPGAETRRKMSEALYRRYQDPAEREKIRLQMMGNKFAEGVRWANNPELRAKRLLGLQTPESIAKRSKSLKQFYLNPANRLRHTRIMSSPETRAKLSVARRNRKPYLGNRYLKHNQRT